MIRTWPITVVLMGLLAALPVRAADDEEESGEEETAVSAPSGAVEQKTLAERIPSVTRRVFVKKHRLELIPGVGTSLNDPFYDHVILSARAAYHVTEWMWVEAGGCFFSSVKAGIPVSIGNPVPPSYNRPVYSAGLDVAFAPLYGKLSLMAERVIHFDTFLALGAGVVGPKDGGSALYGSAAVGQHLFLNEWLALRVELRDQVFQMARAPTVDPDKALQNMLSFSVGVAFFVPPSFQHEVL